MLKYKILTLTQEFDGHTSAIHPVMFYTDSDLILCDAGYPGQTEQIKTELNKYGFSASEITKTVITHYDHDHLGSLCRLKEENKNITVISSGIEAPFIQGFKKSLRLIQAEEYIKILTGKELEFGIKFANYLATIEPCKVDLTVTDGDYIIPGLRVIHTPGHTPGHISLFCEESSTLIAGDAIAAENKRLMVANPEYTLDLNTCLKSIEKIIALAPEKIICYHGGLIEDDIKNQLENILLEYR